MRAPQLLKVRSKSTPAFWFTKQKKLAYAFYKPEHPFKEHYQTRPKLIYAQSEIIMKKDLNGKETALK